MTRPLREAVQLLTRLNVRAACSNAWKSASVTIWAISSAVTEPSVGVAASTTSDVDVSAQSVQTCSWPVKTSSL